MVVRIKKLNEVAVIPGYKNPGDAGMDLTAISINLVNEDAFGYVEYGTGLSIQIPEGYVGLIFPRSSISETGMFLANAVGVIDSGYRGEIKCRFKWIPDTIKYKIGDRVAQLMILPYPSIQFEEVDRVDDTVRASGGFGSTN